MNEQPGLARFGLYGEGAGSLAPEFLHLEPISSRSALHHWTIAPHSHPRIHQLLLLENGGAHLLADEAAMDLAPLSLVAIPSHCVHAFRFEPGTEGWVFSFAVDLLNDPRLAGIVPTDLFTRRGASVTAVEPGTASLARLRWLLGDMASASAEGALARPTPCIIAQVALLLATAGELLADRATPAAEDRQRALALRYRQLVDARFRDGLDVADYARLLGASVATLTRACRAVLDAAPGEVLRARLLLEALRDLTFTSASVAAISDRLGFSDPAYFARFFKQRTGRTASEFRRDGGWFDDQPGLQPRSALSKAWREGT
jgi:AraC family transcriptional regulator, transcriptional activator of pobA